MFGEQRKLNDTNKYNAFYNIFFFTIKYTSPFRINTVLDRTLWSYIKPVC